MLDSRLAAYVGVVTVLVLIPGPDLAIIARVALSDGRRAARNTVYGINVGLIARAFAAALGVATLLSSSAVAFTALKLAGACYLVVLGIRTWRGAVGNATVEGPSTPAVDGAAAFRMGLASNVLNPKVALIYLTVIPQFVSRGDPVVARSLLLAAILNVVALFWQLTYAELISRLGDVFRHPRVRRGFERVTATALVALGVRLAVDR